MIHILKNISLIIALSLMLYSCTDDATQEVILPSTTATTGELLVIGKNIDGEIVAISDEELAYSVKINEVYDKPLEISVTAISKNLIQTTSKVSLAVGESSASGIIRMPKLESTNKISGTSDYVSVQITGIALFDETKDEDDNVVLTPSPSDNVTLTSNEVLVTYYDKIQESSSDVAGKMTVLIDWVKPADNNLNMFIHNATTNAIVQSVSTADRWEAATFDDMLPDGDYFVEIEIAKASQTDIPYQFFFVHPNQTTTEIFAGTLTGLTIGDDVNTNVSPVINFTKTSDANGVGSYTFSQP